MEYYTTADVMRILGVSRNTVQKLIESGCIPVLRIGRIIRIEKEGFDRWRKHSAIF